MVFICPLCGRELQEDAKFCDRCRFVLSTFWRNLEPIRNLRLELERCLAERSRAEQQLGKAPGQDV